MSQEKGELEQDRSLLLLLKKVKRQVVQGRDSGSAVSSETQAPIMLHHPQRTFSICKVNSHSKADAGAPTITSAF